MKRSRLTSGRPCRKRGSREKPRTTASSSAVPRRLGAKKIDLRLGAKVAALNLAERKIVLADGSDLTWTGLALATGARAQQPHLPGADLPGVCVLRDAFVPASFCSITAMRLGSSAISSCSLRIS